MAEVTAEDTTFVLAWNVEEGRVYDWSCVATSVNPNMLFALYSTEVVSGTVESDVSVPEGSGMSTLFSSIFTALFMLIAAFYYWVEIWNVWFSWALF